MSKSNKRKKLEKKLAADASRIAEAVAAHKPWNPPNLIQRLNTNEKPRLGAKGIDALFSFDYMGSAEFEFGALFRALKSMREAPDIHPEPIRIKTESFTIWYVGIKDEKILEWAKRLVLDQVGPQRIFFRDRTNMKRALEGEKGHVIPEAWWAIDQPVPWLLFMKKDHAKLWLGAM